MPKKLSLNLVLSSPGNDYVNTPGYMMELIAASLGKSMNCYSMKTRERDIVELRFIATVFMRIYFPYVTLQQIAALFGGLDHSSVISGLSRAYSLLHERNARFTHKYNQALKAVNLWLEKMGNAAA